MKKIKILFILIALMSIQSCDVLQEYGDQMMYNAGYHKTCYEDYDTGKITECKWDTR